MDIDHAEQRRNELKDKIAQIGGSGRYDKPGGDGAYRFGRPCHVVLPAIQSGEHDVGGQKRYGEHGEPR